MRSAAVGGILLGLIEGVGILITKMTAEQFKPGKTFYFLHIPSKEVLKVFLNDLSLGLFSQKYYDDLFSKLMFRMINTSEKR